MSFVLRIKWPSDNKPSDKPDFEVFDGETAVGRIYETHVAGGSKWRWTLYVGAVNGENVPSGHADSFPEVQAKFKAAWEKEKR